MIATTRRKMIAAGAAALAVGRFATIPVRAAQFEFKAASNFGVDHPTTIRQKEMWSVIEQESNGRIHTTYYPNSILGGDAAKFTQMRMGAISFILLSPGTIAGVVPALDVSYLGFAYKDPDEAMRVMAGGLGEYMRRQTADKNIHMCRTWWDVGMFQIASSTHPIRTPDDLKGFKLRVPDGRITVDLFKDLGASPIPMNFAEVYTGLQTKILDGVSAPLGVIEASRFYEVVKYVSITNHAWGGIPMISNGEQWAALGPKLQEIVERNNTKYALLASADGKAADDELGARFTRRGLTVNTVNQVPFRAPLRAYYESWSSTFGNQAWGLLERGLGHKLT